MWLPLLLSSIGGALVGLHRTKAIGPTMPPHASRVRITLRAMAVAAVTCVLVYISSAAIVITALPDVREAATVGGLSKDAAFALVVALGFVGTHAIVRGAAAAVFNSWERVPDTEPEQEK